MDEKYTIGIDVDGTKTAYGLFNESGGIVYRGQHPTDAVADGPSLSETIVNVVEDILTANCLLAGQVLGIGLGMPSFINYDTGFVYMTTSIPNVKDIGIIGAAELVRELL